MEIKSFLDIASKSFVNSVYSLFNEWMVQKKTNNNFNLNAEKTKMVNAFSKLSLNEIATGDYSFIERDVLSNLLSYINCFTFTTRFIIGINVIKNPKSFEDTVLKASYNNIEVETLKVWCFDCHGEMIDNGKSISIGTETATIFNVKTIVKYALEHNAFGIVVSHNHPNSMDCSPSNADTKSTIELVKACKLFNIRVIDHYIVGNTLYSYKKSNPKVLN